MKILYANPSRHDYLHATLIEGLTSARNLELCCLNDGNYGARASHCFNGDVAAAIAMMPTFDVVVVGSHGKHASVDGAVAKLAAVPKAAGQRWVFVDSGDFGSLPRLSVAWKKFDAVLKRELYRNDNSPRNLFRVAAVRQVRHPVDYQFRGHPLLPFPNVQCNAQARPALVAFHQRRSLRLPRDVAIRCEPIGVESRLMQTFNESPVRGVTCTLAGNTDARRRLIASLTARDGVIVRQIPVHPDEPVDLVASGAVSAERAHDHVHNTAYFDWLRAHRASISFPGAGFDTARFWEILASGSCLISKRVALDLPVPLRDGCDYIGFDTLAELNSAIEFALSDSPEVDEIRRSGQQRAIAEYSSSAIADRFIRRELLGG